MSLTSACSKWLLVSRQLLTHLPRHSKPLLMLDVRRDMKSFYTGMSDKTLKLYRGLIIPMAVLGQVVLLIAAEN